MDSELVVEEGRLPVSSVGLVRAYIPPVTVATDYYQCLIFILIEWKVFFCFS